MSIRYLFATFMAAEEIQSQLLKEYQRDNLCRILALDGGGAKGFYTLGVLKEIEAMLDCPLYKRFDIIFGTSTGAIIAALLALGFKIDDIHDLYKKHVPTVMSKKKPAQKTKALAVLASEVFGTYTFTQVKTQIGIVATQLDDRGWLASASGSGFKKDAISNLTWAAESLGVGEAIVASEAADGLALVLNKRQRRMPTYGVTKFF
jgi:predicted acylesterase/phospholipase RssA